MDYKLPDISVDNDGKALSYRSDKSIRSEHQKISLSADHVTEISKCMNDIVYFAETYCYIQTLGKGRQLIELYGYQRKLLRQMVDNRFNIVLQPRQSGKSVMAAIFILWSVLFNNDYVVGMCSNTGGNAKEIFGKILLMFKLLPHYIKPGVKEFNKSTLRLGNQSVVMSSNTTANTFRGYSLNLLFVDECAFIHSETWSDFYKSVYATITADTTNKSKIVMVSTPNSLNHYYELWLSATEKRSLYKSFRVFWTDVPRDDQETFKNETIANTSYESWRQEFLCEFLGSAKGLIPPHVLDKLKFKDAIRKGMQDEFEVYYEIDPDHQYILVGDVSEGVGKDYSIANVIDLSTRPFRQVAMYRSNTVQLTVFPSVIETIGKMFNDALVLVENNSIGKGVVLKLWGDIQYENLYIDDKGVGLRTTKATKKSGASQLREILENDILEINSFQAIKELSNFVARKGSFAASPGNTDDIAMTLLIFAYFQSTEYFKESYDTMFIEEIYDQKVDDTISERLEDLDYDYNFTVPPVVNPNIIETHEDNGWEFVEWCINNKVYIQKKDEFMAWVATVSILDMDYGNINTVNVIRVSQIKEVVTTQGITMSNDQSKKYYFTVVTTGEIMKSKYYDTEAEALAKQVAAESAINV